MVHAHGACVVHVHDCAYEVHDEGVHCEVHGEGVHDHGAHGEEDCGCAHGSACHGGGVLRGVVDHAGEGAQGEVYGGACLVHGCVCLMVHVP